MIGRRFLISGLVQGVGFRAHTRRQARLRGIVGHALNLPDGRVEVAAYGTNAAVSELGQWLQRGPPTARVDSVLVSDYQVLAPAVFAIG